MDSKGIHTVADLFDINGNPKSREDLNIDSSQWLKLLNLQKAIPKYWREMIKPDYPQVIDKETKFEELSNCSNVSKRVYQDIKSSKLVLHKCADK